MNCKKLSSSKGAVINLTKSLILPPVRENVFSDLFKVADKSVNHPSRQRGLKFQSACCSLKLHVDFSHVAQNMQTDIFLFLSWKEIKSKQFLVGLK